VSFLRVYLVRKVLLRIAGGASPGLEPGGVAAVNVKTLIYDIRSCSNTAEALTIGSSVQASISRAVGRIRERLLGETRVAGPEFHGDTIGRVRAGIKTEIRVVILNQAIGKKVEPLVGDRWVARFQGDRRTILNLAIRDRAEVLCREVELDVLVGRGIGRRGRRRSRRGL
jgi:hypothetical protein